MSTATEPASTGLAAMRKSELKIEWRRHYGTDPPDISAGLLRAGIAYRLEEKAHGALPRSLQKELRRIAAGAFSRQRAAGRLKPGTRLVRSWNKRTIVVLVTEEGFRFEDRDYGSLSEIARDITGARWSGPRFFGLTRQGKAAADGGG